MSKFGDRFFKGYVISVILLIIFCIGYNIYLDPFGNITKLLIWSVTVVIVIYGLGWGYEKLTGKEEK